MGRLGNVELTRADRGILPACDMPDLVALERLVEATGDLPFVCGYKIGSNPVLAGGISSVVQIVRSHSQAPIVYDHQKFGTDIPEICSGTLLDLLADAGVAGLIIFPQAGIRTLEAAVAACFKKGLVPIVGGEMTHQGYLASENGYIADDAPERMYQDAARLGVEHLVIPGTRLDRMTYYRAVLETMVANPKFFFPGIGKGQGGDIVQAFKQVAPHRSYAIVGRGIYAERDMRMAATRLWAGVRAAFPAL